ncbi:hypothetical protein MSHO_30040 [Mycobacterium shottsii]|uniref:AMP-dependent synthetase/ligase domain-containing protein n=2 Tax=Mycobacterium shottsii TaxID=133549 RepID=A0A7I7LE19_9MYCO|nr:AMP-binding protein [Mycobacterium shottsii]BBX57659.1 hypothetical protein MSHO_30040 [Mycobacterium shottsii]
MCAIQANLATDAVRFLPRGEGPGTVISYEGLHARAAHLAAVLQARGAQGERVILASRDNIEMTVGLVACLYSGAVAVPVPVTNMNKLGPALLRLQAIARDAQARVFLTDLPSVDSQSNVRTLPDGLSGLTWLNTDDASADRADWQPPAVCARERGAAAVHLWLDRTAQRGDAHPGQLAVQCPSDRAALGTRPK